MIKTFNLLKLAFFILLVVSCAADADDAIKEIKPLDYYEAKNVSYGASEQQVMDLYLPGNRTQNTKVLILVHGGGWTSGDKKDMDGFKDIIKRELPTLAIVNINYRLATEANPPYPMQIDDITLAIEHLKTKASEYTISTDFGFIGVSAGAHLSLLWSYAFDTNHDVSMVCSIVGPTNFTDPVYFENPLLKKLGGDLSISFLEKVSPYHQVTKEAPPTILFYGEKDPLVPPSQGQDLHNKLLTLDVTAEYTLYLNEAHGWTGANLIDTQSKLKAFIENHL